MEDGKIEEILAPLRQAVKEQVELIYLGVLAVSYLYLAAYGFIFNNKHLCTDANRLPDTSRQ